MASIEEIRGILNDLEDRLDWSSITPIGGCLEGILKDIIRECHDQLPIEEKKLLIKREQKIGGTDSTYHKFMLKQLHDLWKSANIPNLWAQIKNMKYPPDIFKSFPFYEFIRNRNVSTHQLKKFSPEKIKRYYFDVKDLLNQAYPQNTEQTPQKKRIKNLPAGATNFVGRSAEIEKMLRWLSKDSRVYLISITGAGGVGKSALAIEVANRCFSQQKIPSDFDKTNLDFEAFIWTSAKKQVFKENKIHPRFADHADLESIVSEIIRNLSPDLKEMPDFDEQAKIARDLLASMRVLLIVDNMETINDDRVMSFLEDIPSPSKAIITDRRIVPATSPIRLAQLSDSEATRLVEEECKARDLSLNQEQKQILIKGTGGIPLAVIWAIGQMSVSNISPSSVLSRLNHLKHGEILSFLFENSYKQLSDDAVRIFFTLSCLNMAVHATFLSQWCNIGELETEDAIIQLLQLALITEEKSNGSSNSNLKPISEKQFRLLPLTKNYIQLLDEYKNNEFKYRESIVSNVLNSLTSREDSPEWPSSSTIEYIFENIDLIAWCVEDAFKRHAYTHVTDLVGNIGYALGIRGLHDLRVKLANVAIEAAKKINDNGTIAINLVTNIGWTYFNFWHKYEECQKVLEEGLELAVAVGDKKTEGIALRTIGLIAKENKDLVTAETYLTKSKEIFEELNDLHFLAITYGSFGSLYREMRRFEEANEFLNMAFTTAKDLKNADEIKSIFLAKMAKMLIKKGSQSDLDKAEKLNNEALEIARMLNRNLSIGYSNLYFGLIAKKRGDQQSAEDYADKAEQLFVKHGAKEDILEDLEYIRHG